MKKTKKKTGKPAAKKRSIAKKTAAKKKATKATKATARIKVKKVRSAVTKKKAAGKKAKSVRKTGAKPKPRVTGKPAYEMPEMNRVVIPIDKTVYPLDAIYGAAYVFLDRAYVYLEKDKGDIIKISLTGKTTARKDALMTMGGEFVNELLNQAIRSNLDDSAKKIREYIVVKSHYGRQESRMDIDGLLDQTLKEAFDEDPLDIAVPWEDKYGKEKEKRK